MEEGHDTEPGRCRYIGSMSCSGGFGFVHSNSDIKTECPAEEMCVGHVLLAVLGKSRYGGLANLGGVNAPTIADLKLPMI